MSWIDLILNIVGLLLWLNWRAAAIPAVPAPGVGLASTLRPAGSARRRSFPLAGLALLLLGRAVFYWQVGPPVDWIARMPLGPTTLSFSSSFPGRILLFSILSFAVTLGIFYLCLLLLSWVNSRMAGGEAARGLIRAHLGRVDRWPNWMKSLLPLLVTAGLWCAIHPLLTGLGVAPQAGSVWRLVAQGAVIGLGSYLALKFLLVGLLALHIVNNYVYLGEFPFWKWVNATARELLRPVKSLPLRAGKIDFAPIAAIAAVLVAAEIGQRGLTRLYEKLM